MSDWVMVDAVKNIRFVISVIFVYLMKKNKLLNGVVFALKYYVFHCGANGDK